MRNVSVRGIVRLGILATAVLALHVVPAGAQGTNGGREIRVSALGTTNRFSPPMRTVDDLKAMVNTNRNQLTHVLTMGGLADIAPVVLDTLTAGDVTDTTVAPGTQIKWMAIKRRGTPAILQNVRWTGRQSFDGWQFTVRTHTMIYTFVVPKICGNMSLLSVVPAPPVVTEAPPPPPPPAPPPPPRVVIVQPPPPPPPAPAPVVPATTPVTQRHWIASANVGTSFETKTTTFDVLDDNGVNDAISFGGQIGYMFRRYIGAEFLADFSPNVPFANVFLADDPRVNSYMGNVIGAVPLGEDGQFRPYVSGGVGAITLHTSIFTSPDITNFDTASTTRGRFASNIGGGLLIFAGRVGVRADVRHFTTTTGNTGVLLIDSVSASDLTRDLLSGLSYWRSNVGIAFRW